jgi:hypothetical protein
VKDFPCWRGGKAPAREVFFLARWGERELAAGDGRDEEDAVALFQGAGLSA